MASQITSEIQLQAFLFQWFFNEYPQYRGRLRRIKNELDNHPRKSKLDKYKQLNENKATGCIPGDSDLYWIAQRITYIELKIPTGTQSDEQKAFSNTVSAFGHKYVLIKEKTIEATVQAFKELMLNLIKH